jgi:hypothetical protein
MSAAMKKARLPETIHSTPNANPHLWTKSRTQNLVINKCKVRRRGTDINFGV